MKTLIASALAISLGASAAQAQSTSPHANPNAPENAAVKAPHETNRGVLAAGSNSFTKGQARGHMEREGYSKVTGLVKGKDGLWRGRAMKDGKSVRVALDFKGNVTSN